MRELGKGIAYWLGNALLDDDLMLEGALDGAAFGDLGQAT